MYIDILPECTQKGMGGGGAIGHDSFYTNSKQLNSFA